MMVASGQALPWRPAKWHVWQVVGVISSKSPGQLTPKTPGGGRWAVRLRNPWRAQSLQW